MSAVLSDVRLIDGVRELVVWGPSAAAGVFMLDVDFGFAEARDAVLERPDDDGTDDDTAFHGASAVTMVLDLAAPNRANLDLVRWFARAAGRPYLVVTDTEWTAPRRARLRGSQLGAPITSGSGLARRVQVGWRNPLGVWEDSTETETPINVIGTATTGLRVTPLAGGGLTVTPLAAGGVTVAAGTAGGSTTLTTPAGSVDTHWRARLYGPAVAPALANDTTGETIVFTSSMALSAGEYLELNSRDRTARLFGLPDASRAQYLDFAATSWWKLVGDGAANQLRYAPVSGAGPTTQAQVFWRPTWM